MSRFDWNKELERQPVRTFLLYFAIQVNASGIIALIGVLVGHWATR
jgi:hypothetical protein